MFRENPQDNIPEGPGRLFNHTADYTIPARLPVEKEGGNLRLEPRSPPRLQLPVLPAFRLQCITAMKYLPACAFVKDNEGELLATRNSIKG